jgi:GT2 family glycosyltransferase
MQVSIVIINYNTFRLTSDCIRSVIETTKDVSYEIILVDNASTETDAGEFLKEFPAIRLVRNPRNTGFADGNNQGISRSSGKYVLLLNSDTVLREDSVSRAVAAMEEQPGTGILGCRMEFPGGQVQYTARRFRSISWELLDLFRFIPLLMPYEKRAQRMLGKYFRHDRDASADWVNGAFFLVRRELIDKLPGKKLDDRFFMYGEDQLWCEQARALGYATRFFSGTTIVHIHSGSTDISRHLRLRKIMLDHELEIMRLRKGRGAYYYLFKIIFVGKEGVRNMIKWVVFKLTGRMMR